MKTRLVIRDDVKCPYCGKVAECDHFLGHTTGKRRWKYYDQKTTKLIASGDIYPTDQLRQINQNFFKVFRGK